MLAYIGGNDVSSLSALGLKQFREIRGFSRRTVSASSASIAKPIPVINPSKWLKATMMAEISQCEICNFSPPTRFQ